MIRSYKLKDLPSTTRLQGIDLAIALLRERMQATQNPEVLAQMREEMKGLIDSRHNVLRMKD